MRRLMKELNLVPMQVRKCKATINSKHSVPVALNLFNRDFGANAPCQNWLGDLTSPQRKGGYTWEHLSIFIPGKLWVGPQELV